jgi:hypothetical protein
MTLGELKLKCLKLMFDIEEADANPSSAEYETRTVAMIDSINRGLDRIDNANKIPIKEDITHTYDSDYEMWELIPIEEEEDDSTDLETTYGLKDKVLNIIPYFVKGELFEEDEANIALLSFNKFEQLLEQLPTPPKNDSIRNSYVEEIDDTTLKITKVHNRFKYDE